MDLSILCIPCKRTHGTHGLLCLFSLTYHKVFKVHPRCNTYQNFIHFYDWILFHYAYRPHFVPPFIHLWTRGLFSPFGYCELCCDEYVCMNTCFNICFQSFWLYTCMPAKSLQSCPTVCDSMGCSPPGSSVHGILQARTLEWVAVPSSGYIPRSRIAGSNGNSMLIFFEEPPYFLLLLHHYKDPLAMHEDSHFSTSLSLPKLII